MPELILSCKVPVLQRFWCRVQKTDTCWNWTGFTNPDGYGRFRGKDGRKILTHRFSWELHFGAIPNGQLVLHRCDNPPCVNPDHLFLGDDADNCFDRDTKWRLDHKLSESDIYQIRHFARFIPHAHLAVLFGVSGSNISAVASGRTWKFVKSGAALLAAPLKQTHDYTEP